jgi:hypothetical protein
MTKITFQHKPRNLLRNLTFKVQIVIRCVNIQEGKLTRHTEHRLLKNLYTTSQTTIIETGNQIEQKEEIHKISKRSK